MYIFEFRPFTLENLHHDVQQKSNVYKIMNSLIHGKKISSSDYYSIIHARTVSCAFHMISLRIFISFQ